jgi:hypothetical protein
MVDSLIPAVRFTWFGVTLLNIHSLSQIISHLLRNNNYKQQMCSLDTLRKQYSCKEKGIKKQYLFIPLPLRFWEVDFM